MISQKNQVSKVQMHGGFDQLHIMVAVFLVVCIQDGGCFSNGGYASNSYGVAPGFSI